MDLRPAIPVAIDADPTRVLVDQRTGARLAEYEHVYTEYDAGRIREGYCCAHCGQAQAMAAHAPCRICERRDGRIVYHKGEPFPEHCYVCGFPMRDQQAAKFAEDFDGYTTIGPSRSLEELRAEDEEAKARAQYARQKPTSSIWIPS